MRNFLKLGLILFIYTFFISCDDVKIDVSIDKREFEREVKLPQGYEMYNGINFTILKPIGWEISNNKKLFYSLDYVINGKKLNYNILIIPEHLKSNKDYYNLFIIHMNKNFKILFSRTIQKKYKSGKISYFTKIIYLRDNVKYIHYNYLFSDNKMLFAFNNRNLYGNKTENLINYKRFMIINNSFKFYDRIILRDNSLPKY